MVITTAVLEILRLTVQKLIFLKLTNTLGKLPCTSAILVLMVTIQPVISVASTKTSGNKIKPPMAQVPNTKSTACYQFTRSLST
jgi:hypothetical protein